MRSYLNFICAELDYSYTHDIKQKRNRTFWLSVSAYGCFSLTDYIAYSRRDINLQPLSPIFPITHNFEKFNILPLILQCFKKENRKKIVPTKENMDLLKELSLLMMKSGGHPRRVSELLLDLFQIDFRSDYLMFDNYRENYATSKLKELKNAELESVMNLKFQFKIGDSFVQESFANSKNNDALQNMVQPFLFSSLAKEGEGKKTKLILDDGYGNYVPTLDKKVFYLFLTLF